MSRRAARAPARIVANLVPVLRFVGHLRPREIVVAFVVTAAATAAPAPP